MVGRLVVDRLDPEQGEVPLVLLGRADLAGDRVAGPQAEPADLAGRDVDVVGAGQVVVVRAAEEPEAVGQDLERPSPNISPFCLTRSLRILKIRSCLRIPVAPATARSLAIWVSFWMLISFSSVMFSPFLPSLPSAFWSSRTSLATSGWGGGCCPRLDP